MNPSVFRTNRAAFPRVELEKHCGQWIAFAADGARIVASASTFEEVEELVRAAGEDPNQVVFERVPGPDDDVYLGSEEFRACCNSPISTSP